jgi:hypothetical protein
MHPALAIGPGLAYHAFKEDGRRHGRGPAVREGRMDVVYDYVSVNTFWTILLIIHGLLAVALLGALTHQTAAVLMPVRQTAGGPSFTERFRSVHGPSYAAAVCVLWVVAFIFGAWIYTKYRIYVRIPIEQDGFWKTQGTFELKEHFATIGLGMLPIYWLLWKNPREPEFESARKWTTVVLAAMCWYIFLVGHVVNNVRGFGS